jgi:hypothetical protein
MRSILSAGRNSTYISNVSRITAIMKEQDARHSEKDNATSDKTVDGIKLLSQLMVQCSIQMWIC